MRAILDNLVLGKTPAPFKEQERVEFLQYLQAEKRQSILEIGCGPGHDAQFFQNQRLNILALDNAPTMVQLTQKRGIAAQCLDCYNLDQISQKFDAIYSMNCLLHVPQQDINHILNLVAARLNESGLFYLGLWGGKDFEGIFAQDEYEPKRFFSFYKTETLLSIVQQPFSLEYFRKLESRKGLVFHSLIGRKR